PEDDNSPLYPPPPAYNPQVPTVSEDVARDALLKFVESKWRYSSKPARNLTFKELSPITVYRYRLETYTESRTSTWKFEPYNVDGPEYGTPPPPWDVPVTLPDIYTDVVMKVRVPHTSFIKVCHTCHGCGRTRCVSCFGRGMVRTFSFSESFCHLSLTCRCISCHGRGFKTCHLCQGSQNLLHYILLTVTWKNNISEHIPDRQPDFPDEKFEQVTGDAFFVDESLLVYPIQGFPEQEICEVSRRLIADHLNRFSSNCRILQQVQQHNATTQVAFQTTLL
uniref:Ssu-2 homolog n=1 Tax=Echeneis naucrates TaxID=173247 RepID=A0A665TSG9_ECHNA